MSMPNLPNSPNVTISQIPETALQPMQDQLSQQHDQFNSLISALQPLPQRLNSLDTQILKQSGSTQRQVGNISNQLASILPLEQEENRLLMLKLNDLLTSQKENSPPEILTQLSYDQHQIQQSLAALQQKPTHLKLFLNGNTVSYRGILLMLLFMVNCQPQCAADLGDGAGVAGDSAASQSASQQHRDSVGADGEAVGLSEAQIKQSTVARILLQGLKQRQVLATEGSSIVWCMVATWTLTRVALDGRGEILRGDRGMMAKADLAKQDLEMVQRVRDRLEIKEEQQQQTFRPEQRDFELE
jgi:hypothetical protein